MKLKLFLLPAILTVIFSINPGCSGGTPAAPPGPVAEVPVPIVLKFVEPALLKIGVSSFSGFAVNMSTNKAVGDFYPAEILYGFELATLIDQNYTSLALTNIGEIEVPFEVTVTSYHDTVDFPVAFSFLSGPKDIKIDFSDFDFDNDGVLEGCSGNATPYLTQAELQANDPATARPICARMWVDDQRYVAWVFDQFYVDPNIANVAAVNVGAGKFKAFLESASTPTAIAFSYNHVDPQNKSTEQFVKGFFTEPVGTDDNETWHSLFSQDGPDSGAVVSMNMNYVYDRVDFENNIGGMRSLGKYVLLANDTPPFANLLGASFDYEDQLFPFILRDFTDQCIQISDGLSIDPVNCENVDINNDGSGDGFNIRVFDAAFIRPLDDTDIAVPNDFPAAPPSPPF